MQLAACHKKGPALHVVALLLGEGLTVIALALFAYLGTFTRYLAADCCEAMQVANGGVWKALAWRYQHASDRFSNLLFDALSEPLAPRNVRIIPVAMIALWTVALVWLVHQARRLAGLQWPLLVDVFLGSILAFFPIFEAPNRRHARAALQHTDRGRWAVGCSLEAVSDVCRGGSPGTHARDDRGKFWAERLRTILPIERARFAGRLMMTSAAVLEGTCAGMVIGQLHAWRSRPLLANLASLALVLSTLYQVRGAALVLQEDLLYAREWAAAWDVRESGIRVASAAGVEHVVIPQLPGFENVRELAPRASVWINRCAAKLYGVKSISAPQMGSLH